MIRRNNPVGNRLCESVIYNGLVFTSGQVSLDNKGGTIEEQTHDVLGMIDRILAEAGSDRTRILSASIWLSDINDIDAFNAIWDQWIPEGSTPARACVEARLVSPDFIVEVAVTAAVEGAA